MHGGRGAGVTCVAGLVLACATLVGITDPAPALPASPHAESPRAAARAARSPMPARLSPGAWTAPVFPQRSVPGYVGQVRLGFRLAPGSGARDTSYPFGTRAGETTVLGDWDGDGAETPARFVDGTWSFWETLVAARASDRTVSFGQAGDRPVVGDWDGDGRTDLGVVRDGVWTLALGSGRPGQPAPAAWRTLSLGGPGATPLAGDWDGDGTDGPAAFFAGTWTFLQAADPASPSWTLTWGGTGDEAVAGDWDANRTDTVALVRGDRWTFRHSTDQATTATHTRTIARVAGTPPIAWRTLAGQSAAGCPTARAAVTSLGARVVPSTVLGRSLTLRATDPASRVRATLTDSERFLLGEHYEQTWAARRASPWVHLLDGPRPHELDVRLPAMTALAVAIAARTGAHDDTRVGRTRAQATAYVDWLVRSIACEHESVSPGGWGTSFQSAHWAQLTAEAAWLVWDGLTPQTRDYVAAMLVAEADHQVAQPITSWMTRDRVIVSPGNTYAEELSWSAGALETAVTMLPGLTRAVGWRRASVQLATAAYSRPADLASTRTVNGVALRHRLGGANAWDDGTVENHSRLHPDYASNIQHLWWAADLAGLARRPVPEAMFHNGRLVYSGLSTVAFTAGAPSPAGGVFGEPGGTVYRVGSNGVYYPQGSDWGTVRRAHWLSLDAHAWAYQRLMPQTGWSPRAATGRHVTGQRALMAAGGPSGRTYSPDPAVAATQDTYPGREEYAAQQVATAWLALYVARVSPPAIDRGLVPLPVAPTVRRRPVEGPRPEPLTP